MVTRAMSSLTSRPLPSTITSEKTMTIAPDRRTRCPHARGDLTARERLAGQQRVLATERDPDPTDVASDNLASAMRTGD